MSDWRPIESAPINVNVLIYCPMAADDYRVMICTLLKFYGDPARPEWCLVSDTAPAIDVTPTHWQPLPDPPVQP